MAEAFSEQQAIDAIAALDTPAEVVEPQEQAEAQEPEQVEDAATDEPEAPTEGEEVEDVAEQPEEGEGTAEDDVEGAEALDAPVWWDAEAKEHFRNIPKNAKTWALKTQLILAEQEAKREAVTQKIKAEAAAAKQTYSSEAEALRGALSKLSTSVPAELEAFEAKYKNVDWDSYPQWARENPDAALQFEAEYRAEKTALEQKLAAKAEAEQLAQAAFVREQTERLREVAPDLISNPENLRALGNYAAQQGFAAEALKQASADELVILNKARLWDESQKKAAALATAPKINKTAPMKTVKPVASGVTASHKQRQAIDAKARVMQTGNDDDAIRAIASLGL